MNTDRQTSVFPQEVSLHEDGGVAEMMRLLSIESDFIPRSEADSGFVWMSGATLSVVVLGASGDLARRKTFPALLNLFSEGLVPQETVVFGYGRTKMTDQDLRNEIRPHLLKVARNEVVVDSFLRHVLYQETLEYGSIEGMSSLAERLEAWEKSHKGKHLHHRLFYFAVPPHVYAYGALAIQATAMHDRIKEGEPGFQGFCRIILEKPLGRDLESYQKLNKSIRKFFEEDQLYRIDHYLAKEMVLNLTVMRFSNRWIERIWNRDHIQCVMITFKSVTDIAGRGGYFDNYGIIRDIVQNHLLQILCLVAMEAPAVLEGSKAVEAIRNAKMQVLEAIGEIKEKDALIGQYEGYLEEPTVENKHSITSTFAAVRVFVNNRRWGGVPFILKAGKAMDCDKAEIRLQFKDSKHAMTMFEGKTAPRNEFVMLMKPNEAVYIKTNIKSPGFSNKPIQAELEVDYNTNIYVRDGSKAATRDAYTRLLLDVCRGKQGHFVRDDEVVKSWEIFDAVLKRLYLDSVVPLPYKKGSRGPQVADDWIKEKAGYDRNVNYEYNNGSIVRKSEHEHQKMLFDYARMCYVPRDVPLTNDRLCDVGIYGMAPMGQNLALSMASKGFKVAVSSRTLGKVLLTELMAQSKDNLPVIAAFSEESFIQNLKPPRKIFVFVAAGKTSDEVICKLAKRMDPGDVIVDGGNELYHNSIRRGKKLEQLGIQYLSTGISCVEGGACHGLCFMPGGTKEAYGLVEPILQACAGCSAHGTCVGYVGPVGSGDFMKTVHNGIEFGHMQLIAEVYDILQTLCGMSNEEIADLFEKWNEGELGSYLLVISAKILRTKDSVTGTGETVDYIVDKTGSTKGTVKRTIEQATDRGVAAPTISAALEMRAMSRFMEERIAASKLLFGPEIQPAVGSNNQFFEDLSAALYGSLICTYAQGVSLLWAASLEHDWNLDIAECVRIWTGGCTIRSTLLGLVYEKLSENGSLPNLLLDFDLAEELNSRSIAWRRSVALAVMNGIACPSFTSSLAYLDQYRRQILPANLTQAQRDFFGGHSYERIDRAGRFHTAWTESHNEIGDAQERIKGEDGAWGEKSKLRSSSSV